MINLFNKCNVTRGRILDTSPNRQLPKKKKIASLLLFLLAANGKLAAVPKFLFGRKMLKASHNQTCKRLQRLVTGSSRSRKLNISPIYTSL